MKTPTPTTWEMILLMSPIAWFMSISCSRLGKVVIKEGSATSDRVCGNPPTTPKVVTEDGAPSSDAETLETALTTNRRSGSYTERTIGESF